MLLLFNIFGLVLHLCFTSVCSQGFWPCLVFAKSKFKQISYEPAEVGQWTTPIWEGSECPMKEHRSRYDLLDGLIRPSDLVRGLKPETSRELRVGGKGCQVELIAFFLFALLWFVVVFVVVVVVAVVAVVVVVVVVCGCSHPWFRSSSPTNEQFLVTSWSFQLAFAALQRHDSLQ